MKPGDPDPLTARRRAGGPGHDHGRIGALAEKPVHRTPLATVRRREHAAAFEKELPG